MSKMASVMRYESNFGRLGTVPPTQPALTAAERRDAVEAAPSRRTEMVKAGYRVGDDPVTIHYAWQAFVREGKPLADGRVEPRPDRFWRDPFTPAIPATRLDYGPGTGGQAAGAELTPNEPKTNVATPESTQESSDEQRKRWIAEKNAQFERGLGPHSILSARDASRQKPNVPMRRTTAAEVVHGEPAFEAAGSGGGNGGSAAGDIGGGITMEGVDAAREARDAYAAKMKDRWKLPSTRVPNDR